jgi:calcineurin-like phosphoesterase family protein
VQYHFTADPHFWHFNIIRYCNRPFSSIEEMHKTMIANWNQRVKPEDTVFCIGDWGFKKSGEANNAPKEVYKSIKEQLNGNVILIRGNHEGNNDIKTIIHNLVISHGGHKMFLVHDPKYANPNYTINLCGHVHNNWKFKKLTNTSTIINCGMDVWNFRPITINEILSEYSTWKKIC